MKVLLSNLFLLRLFPFIHLPRTWSPTVSSLWRSKPIRGKNQTVKALQDIEFDRYSMSSMKHHMVARVGSEPSWQGIGGQMASPSSSFVSSHFASISKEDKEEPAETARAGQWRPLGAGWLLCAKGLEESVKGNESVTGGSNERRWKVAAELNSWGEKTQLKEAEWKVNF